MKSFILFGVMLALSVSAASLSPVDARLAPNVFVWKDTCNVYVLRDGDAALLIDLGDGSVLDRLADIGVKRVEWVLFTHHHREQCQGAARLKGTGAKLAGPAAERELFEQPANFRKMNVSLGDKFTIHGASYVRPPVEPLALNRTFNTNDTLEWRGHKIICRDTRGNSPGGMSYLIRAAQAGGSTEGEHADARPNRLLDAAQAIPPVAFSGDVILDGARMHTWFDSEWDYGFGAGIKALRESAERLRAEQPTLLLPSHGNVIRNPEKQLREYAGKLERLERLYVRGYDVEHGSVAYQDKVSKPTVVSNVWQVSPHLFKFKRKNFWPNFSLILSDNGRALLSDCGLFNEGFIDEALEGMRQHFGLKAIDAIIVSHMHGDHFLEAEHLREKWGTQVWALDNMVEKMEHPERFDYAAPVQAYGKKKSDGSPLKGVRVDRVFRSGDSFNWEGNHFTIDWMPGQTEFALCLHGMIDGRKVAFTGDNIFGDPENPKQTGHEAMVAHNSAILEEGYIYGAEYLKRLQPDLLMGGHSFVMDRPAAFIERYRQWSYQMRDAFRELSSEEDYRYWFDPFWVRADPYRVSVKRGETAEVRLHVRNFNARAQAHMIKVITPQCLVAETAEIAGSLGSESRAAFPVRLRADGNAQPGVYVVAFDVIRDGARIGPLFDLVVQVDP